MRQVVRSSGRLLAVSWRQDRAKTLAAALLVLAWAAAGPFVAVALRWLTDAAVAGRTAEAALAGLVVAALAIAGLTFGHFAHVAYFELSELNVLDFSQELIRLSNGSAGIAHHECPEYADKITILEQELLELRMGLQALLSAAGLGLAMALTAVLLAMLHPLLLLLPLVAVPPLLTGRRAERVLDGARSATAERTRVALGFFRLATASGPAKELRVFGLQDELRRRHAQVWESATKRLWHAHLGATALQTAGQLTFAIGYVAAVLLIVREAIAGRRGVGDVVLVITLAAQVNQQVAGVVVLLQDLQRLASAFRRLDEVRAAVAESTPAPVDQPAPDRLHRGIELAGVTFAYPGAGRPVLSDVTLTLPAGATVAIVGENGAGKTTLVKLLCGFYRPVRGQILVDGVDLCGIPVEQWRLRMAAGFQDFAPLELAVRETVGVGDLPRLSSDEAVLAALDRAHGRDVLRHLDDGLDTHLGKSYADGVELSSGQWQKLALGRAFMRAQPLLLVLDEPSSALDAEAEHALFERYAQQARRVGQATGGITLLVSHRFSTVRMADLIVVVADGRVVEAGSHAHLLAGGGLYAELYGLQADGYR